MKFTESFDAAFERDDGGVVKTPIMAPVANCFVESWIGSFIDGDERSVAVIIAQVS